MKHSLKRGSSNRTSSHWMLSCTLASILAADLATDIANIANPVQKQSFQMQSHRLVGVINKLVMGLVVVMLMMMAGAFIVF